MDGEWLTPGIHATPHLCYHTKFCRCGSNRLGVGRVPNFLGDAEAPPPCDGDVADPLEIYASSPLVLLAMPNSVILSHTVQA